MNPATQYAAITKGVDALSGGPMSLWPWMMPAPRRRLILPVETIVDEVAKRHRLTVADLIGTGLARPVTLARQEAMWAVKQATTLSYPAIGRFFGRDHTTIIHGVQAHEERRRARRLAA